MKPGRTHLGVFAKYWHPGSVKTRLARDIGEAPAAVLYRTFVETTLQRLSGLAQRHELCFWPAGRTGEAQTVVPPEWEITRQSDGDLGDRMEAFFERAFAAGADRVVLLGSDTPSVPKSFVRKAFELLSRAAVVLGPSADGGYYLVGATARTPPIFRGISWSTPAVWEQTIARIEAAGLRQGVGYALAPAWNDVDTLADLHALNRQLAPLRSRDPSLSRLANAVGQTLENLSG